MKLKLLTAAALSLGMMTGAALAQATSATGQGASPNNATATYLNNWDKVGGFYTDDTMKTFRSADEMKSAWTAMSAEDQAGLKLECEQEASRGTEANALCSQLGSM